MAPKRTRPPAASSSSAASSNKKQRSERSANDSGASTAPTSITNASRNRSRSPRKVHFQTPIASSQGAVSEEAHDDERYAEEEDDDDDDDEREDDEAALEAQLENDLNGATSRPSSGSRAQTSEAREQESDVRIMNGFDKLWEEVDGFAGAYFSFEIPPRKSGREDEQWMTSFFRDSEVEQLVRYAGRIAVGGPKGFEGWSELLLDPMHRRALVYGVIARVFKEKVFNELLFGASREQKARLEKMEMEKAAQDGE